MQVDNSILYSFSVSGGGGGGGGTLNLEVTGMLVGNMEIASCKLTLFLRLLGAVLNYSSTSFDEVNIPLGTYIK